MQRYHANQLTPGVEGHVAVAVCAAVLPQVAVAPCFFQVAAPADDGLFEIQVTPAGEFRPSDGRKMIVDAWRIDAAIAAKVIAEFNGRKTPLVVDYEHQTMHAEKNGQPAPAAARIRELVWRDGSGLWARAELTKRARQYVADGEYQFFSPVFHYHHQTGAVLRLLMGAFTNNPGIDGMAPMELRAAARFALHTEEEETPMKNKLLLAICAALAIAHEGRDEAAVETDAITALDALKNKADPLAALRAQLKLADNVGAEDIVAACASLQVKAQATGDLAPDPSKYVSVAVVEDLKKDIAALSATNTTRAIDDLVKPAIEDGRLLPAQEKWARELGTANLASLTAYLKDAQPIAALSGSQTGGRQPEAKNEDGLTVAELAMCSATGVAPAEFAKSKKTAAA